MNHLEAMDLNEYLRRERLGMSYQPQWDKPYDSAPRDKSDWHIRLDLLYGVSEASIDEYDDDGEPSKIIAGHIIMKLEGVREVPEGRHGPFLVIEGEVLEGPMQGLKVGYIPRTQLRNDLELLTSTGMIKRGDNICLRRERDEGKAQIVRIYPVQGHEEPQQKSQPAPGCDYCMVPWEGNLKDGTPYHEFALNSGLDPGWCIGDRVLNINRDVALWHNERVKNEPPF